MQLPYAHRLKALLFPTTYALTLYIQRIPKVNAAVKKIILRTLKLFFWGLILQGTLKTFNISCFDLIFHLWRNTFADRELKIEESKSNYINIVLLIEYAYSL